MHFKFLDAFLKNSKKFTPFCSKKHPILGPETVGKNSDFDDLGNPVFSGFTVFVSPKTTPAPKTTTTEATTTTTEATI